MRKFENVDIINSLRRIMNINTEHYKNDFFLDVATIHTACILYTSTSPLRYAEAEITDFPLLRPTILIV